MTAVESVTPRVDIEELVKEWRGRLLMLNLDAPTGAWIIIAVHSTRDNHAGGGTRMKPYPDLPSAVRDVLRLSSAMTSKFGVVGFRWGGAKTVIAVPPDLSATARQDLLRRYGVLVHQLGGLYYTGPDVGTSPTDMDTIGEVGGYTVARSPEAGGIGDPGPFTALGVFHSIRFTSAELFGDDSLQGRRILVQGAGDVGSALIRLLHEAGASILVTDVDDAKVRQMQNQYGAEPVSTDAVYDMPCDIFAPCALGDVLNIDTVGRLRCKAVAGAANNQLGTAEDALRLQDRGILYAPDYVCNAGGVLAGWGIEASGWSHEEARDRISTTIAATLRDVFVTAKAEGISTAEAAQRLADQTPVD